MADVAVPDVIMAAQHGNISSPGRGALSSGDGRRSFDKYHCRATARPIRSIPYANASIGRAWLGNPTCIERDQALKDVTCMLSRLAGRRAVHMIPSVVDQDDGARGSFLMAWVGCVRVLACDGLCKEATHGEARGQESGGSNSYSVQAAEKLNRNSYAGNLHVQMHFGWLVGFRRWFAGGR
ncbi:hypothetical protein A9K55_008327 [Cordyceps militaris]|uniref:Uncharacterized protein n=1 Tax=Cordyceps militaris TaxID=73501 RepID=A0A2H4SKJ2_CORMI|nr:hypothetical protein A9K55_008327 [Cordyceps militaris]